MGAARYSYIDPNVASRGRSGVRTKKGDPLDHTYYIQGVGDIRRYVDPRTTQADDTRWRAMCDVCPWLGDWHPGRDAGPKAADEEGHEHRQTHLGQPGWDHCDGCGLRVFDTTLCDTCAQKLEDKRKDPWT